MEKNILVINIGSSSKKYSLYKKDTLLFGAHFEKDKTLFEVTYNSGEAVSVSKNVFTDSLSAFYNAFKKEGFLKDDTTPLAIGLRLVAPGKFFTEDRIVDEEFMKMLAVVADEDRAHIEPVQKEIERIRDLFGDSKIHAISDSSFHSTMPDVARNYALPKSVSKEYGLYRFGYHGISLSSIVSTLSNRPLGLESRVIICHLGSGASITAVREGKSVDTSMGYSPLEGLVMSSRVGNIDAAAVLRLSENMNTNELQEMFYNTCGLLGISNLSNDMRVLIDAEKEGHSGAHEAIEAFVYTIQKYIGMYVSVLGGVDLIVFSGTIGERSYILRDRICSKLGWLNVQLDGDKNVHAKSGDYIGEYGTLGVCVIHSDEDIEIARRVGLLLE